ncbi:MAG TPA: hypothetical protein VN541_24045 [Tepidisphaeraceae bacterium]|nr:hypothetical protein [Tepidisphaeraceae bacterium]
MRFFAIPILAAILLAPPGAADRNRSPSRPLDVGRSNPRFVWVDAYIDPHGAALAAYQFELTARGADVTLVGVEGGEHPAFTQPPYYDPRANVQNRIVIAAYSTGTDLPRSRTRVARVMLRVTGNVSPAYSTKLQVAASPEAKPIEAQIDILEGAAQ